MRIVALIVGLILTGVTIIPLPYIVSMLLSCLAIVCFLYFAYGFKDKIPQSPKVAIVSGLVIILVIVLSLSLVSITPYFPRACIAVSVILACLWCAKISLMKGIETLSGDEETDTKSQFVNAAISTGTITDRIRLNRWRKGQERLDDDDTP